MPNAYFVGNFWWVGVIIAIVGTFIDAVGWVIQKKSHKSIEKKLELQKTSSKRLPGVKYLCDCHWWTGMITHVIGASLFSIAVGLGSQALLMPLQSFNLIFTVLLAYKFLNERLVWVQIVGIVIIIIGCSFAVAFGPRGHDTLGTAKELEQRLLQTEFLVFSGILIAIVVVDYIIYKVKAIEHAMFALLTFELIASFWGAVNALANKMLVEIITTSTSSKGICFTLYYWLTSFQWCEYAEVALANWTHSESWLSYTSLVIVIATTLLLEYWIQEALKIYPANYVNPIYLTFTVILTIVFASLYFQEFKGMSHLYIFVFGLAVFVSFVGVALMAFGDKEHAEQLKKGKIKQTDDGDDEIEEEENNANVLNAEENVETISIKRGEESIPDIERQETEKLL